MNEIKKILAPFASLKLTILLLCIAMLLVLAGTTAQREMGIQDVQHQFFHSYWAKIYFHYFQPTPTAKPGHLPSEGYIPGWFPLPGGYTLIFAMLVNLLAAHTVRFKFRLKRTGIILIHSGLILLLLGELATSFLAVESQMRIPIHGTANFADDIRTAELAIIDTAPKDHDDVTVIQQPRLEAAAGKAAIQDSQLPFDVQVVKFYPNSMVAGPMETGSDIDRLADSGEAKQFGLRSLPKVSVSDSDHTDMPSAFVTLSKNGKSLGTYLVSVLLEKGILNFPMPMPERQKLTVDGKPYEISMRYTRLYKPYTMYLETFTHDFYPGTDMPKDYASTVHLVDPSRHVDRMVKIWMNHPLRFAGETFYQHSFSQVQAAANAELADAGTILQVVHNPAWTMPYIACAIGGFGLALHFSITLISFLRRKLAPTQGTVGAMAPPAGTGPALPAPVGRGRAPLSGQVSTARKTPTPTAPKKQPVITAERYTLSPPPRWQMVGVPVVLFAIGLLCVLVRFIPPTPSPTTASYDLDAFSRIPVQFEGRIQPLDSLARNSLSILSGGHTSFKDKDGKEHPAIEWLLDVMARAGTWDDDKVIRIDHPQVKDLLGLKEEEKLFSWNQIFTDPSVGQKLDKQAQLAADVGDKDRDAYQNQVIELHQHLGVYLRLFQVDAIATRLDLLSHPGKADELFGAAEQALSQADPQLMADLQANKVPDAREAIERAIHNLDLSKLTPLQRSGLAFMKNVPQMSHLLQALNPTTDLYFIPPAPDAKAENAEKWLPLSSAITTEKAPESATAFLKIISDYANQRPSDFNADVAAYQTRVQNVTGSGRASYEVFFNRFSPFYICTVLYVFVLLCAFFSMLFWTRPLWRAGYSLLILTALIHVIGVVSRVVLSGRPPVTNLYSASVFIGLAIVVFAIVMEKIFRNGIGMLAGSIAGFLSLLVAGGFAIGEGDTMKQLQAVLDTNFWLATHVVCVTLGYMASVFAGILAWIYVIRGLANRHLTTEDAKDNSRMIYGIVCFAMLFSFVGTILGGIWADQSWGRFWGWDPKENGAVLVVLWNALILHSRWSGIVRDRGVAVLAILGNIVVGWSFVGTNLLGIGLHSYGFMSGAQMGLITWWALNLALAGAGLIPKKYWASEG